MSWKSPQFALTAITDARRLIVRACGRLVAGHGAAEAVWAPYVARKSGKVVLDLSCVTDMDARGLGVIAEVLRQARQQGTAISITVSSGVRTLVALAQLDRVVPEAFVSAPAGSSTCHGAIPLSGIRQELPVTPAR